MLTRRPAGIHINSSDDRFFQGVWLGWPQYCHWEDLHTGCQTTIVLIPWLSSFLSERTQQVRYRGKLSEPVVTNAGVPQGTRLGPVLFLALVNDALDESTTSRWKYVDDLTIAESRKSTTRSNISQAVQELEIWCESTRMKLNPAKCQFFQISFSRRPPNPEPITISNQPIPECVHVKLLGVTIQNDLKWNKHVCDVVSRSSKKLYMLRTLKKFGLPAEDLLTVFQSYKDQTHYRILRPSLAFFPDPSGLQPNRKYTEKGSTHHSRQRVPNVWECTNNYKTYHFVGKTCQTVCQVCQITWEKLSPMVAP